MKKSFAALFFVSLISSCQTVNEGSANNATPPVAGMTASAIAGDMASRLAEQVGPAGTTLALEKATSEYAVALEAALKGWGYSVIVDTKVTKEHKPVKITWSIDNFDGQVLARLSTPSIVLARAYIATSAGATPASPLSILQQN